MDNTIGDENSPDEYMMENSNLFCEKCCDTSATEFFIQKFLFLCSECVSDDQPKFSVMNPRECRLFASCQKQARWICSKSPFHFCDDCHINNCLLREKQNFECSPQPLFIISQRNKCSRCNKILAEFKRNEDQVFCHRCATMSLQPVSVSHNRIQSVESELYNKYSSSSAFVDKIQKINQYQIEKFKIVLDELSIVAKMKHCVDKTIDYASLIDSYKQQFGENSIIQNKLKKISEFCSKENIILSIIKDQKADPIKLVEMFEIIKAEAELLKCRFSIQKLTTKDQPEEMAMSQEIVEDTAQHLRIQRFQSRQIDTYYDQAFDESVQSSDEEFWPSGDLIPLNDGITQAELIYFRDPLWIQICIGGEIERQRILREMQLIQNPKKLPEFNIGLNQDVLMADVSRRIRDGHFYKRGKIVRLPDSPGGTYCVECLDFGLKIAVRPADIYQIPNTFNELPPTVQNARIIGVAPFSQFSWIQNVSMNHPHKVMNRIRQQYGKKVLVEKKYRIHDIIFVKIFSKDALGGLIDWTNELINSMSVLPYSQNFGCFRSRRNYCYNYHVLDRNCNPDCCSKVHNCSFCQQSHKLKDCQIYIQAELGL